MRQIGHLPEFQRKFVPKTSTKYVHDTVERTCSFHFPYSTVTQHADIPRASSSDLLSKTFKATAF